MRTVKIALIAAGLAIQPTTGFARDFTDNPRLNDINHGNSNICAMMRAMGISAPQIVHC